MKKVGIRGDSPLTYLEFLTLLERNKNSYFTLEFAQRLFCQQLSRGLKNVNENAVVTYYSGDAIKMYETGEVDSSKFVAQSMQLYIIKSTLGKMIDKYGELNRDKIVTNIDIDNMAYLRNNFINACYEILEKYVLLHSSLTNGSKNTNKLKSLLQSTSWYQMLYLMRNNASHHYGLNQAIIFTKWQEKLNPKSFTWRHITVTNGQLGHTLNFSTNDVKALYDEMYDYINSNRLMFITDYYENEIPELQ